MPGREHQQRGQGRKGQPAHDGNPARSAVRPGEQTRQADARRTLDLLAQARSGSPPPVTSTPQALQALQRTAGNRFVAGLLGAQVSSPLLQRDVVDDAAGALAAEQRPSQDSLNAVRTYKFNAKKTSKTSWKRVLQSVKAQEAYWDEVGEHIMAGEDRTPPAGFHSKKRQNANCQPVGEKAPEGVGEASPYKQWIRNRNDTSFDHLKISTFFPDNWPEEKIKAAVLLGEAGHGHQVQASFGLESNDGTTYPATTIQNPPQPQA